MKKTFVKVAVIFVLLATVFGGSFFLFGYKANYSEGNRTGRLMKFSKRGYIFKTCEGTLDLNNISKTNAGMVSSTWDFSVDDSDAKTFEAIDKAMTENKVVKLHYEEKFFQFSWRGDTKYFVTKIEEIHEVSN